VYATPLGKDEENEVDLIDACKANDIDTVLTLIGDNIQKSAVNLDCRISINHPNHPIYSRKRRTVMFENSAFHIVCEAGFLELVQYFIKREECNFHTTNMENQTPLHSAAANDHLQVVKLLVREQKVPNMLNEVDRLGRTPLYVAAQKGHYDVLSFLVTQTFRKKAVVDARARNLSTPLIAAARNGHYDCVKLLIKNSADTEAAMLKGLRPLHASAIAGSLKQCEFLIEEANVDINSVDDFNRTAFFFSCQQENYELVKFFSSYDACDMKIACGFSYTGQESLLAKNNKKIGFYVRDLQRKR